MLPVRGGAMITLVLERGSLRCGMPVRGYVESEGALRVKLVIAVASLLPSGGRRGGGTYSVVLSHSQEVEILGGGSFEFLPPPDAPPTVSTRNFIVRWGVVAGVPRLGGRILMPRTETRLLVAPRPEPHEPPPGVRVEPRYVVPGRRVTVSLDRRLEDAVAELVVREWYTEGDRTVADEYTLAVSDEAEVGDRGTVISLEAPPDPRREGDPYFYYPMTFRSRGRDSEFGISAEIRIEAGGLRHPLRVPVSISV